MRARRLGDYVMTEAKQARLDEIARLEKDRELATLQAQRATAGLKLESKPEPLAEPAAIPEAAAIVSAPIPIPPKVRRTRTKAAA